MLVEAGEVDWGHRIKCLSGNDKDFILNAMENH